jgi:hypothetical protein
MHLSGQGAELDALQAQVQQALKKSDRKAEALALKKLAEKQADLGNIYDALRNADRSIKLYRELGQQSEAYHAYRTIFTIHQQLHNGDKILEYAQPALVYAEKIKDTLLIIRMKNAVGVGFSEKKQFKKATQQYLECLELEKKLGESPNYTNVSSAYIEERDYPRGLAYAKLAIQQCIADKDTFVLAISYVCEAYAHARMRNAAAAQASMSKIEALASSLPEKIIDRELAMIGHLANAAGGNYQTAYRFAVRYHSIDSTLSSSERSAQYAALETLYKTKEKEVENAQLATRLAQQRSWLILVLGALGTLFGIYFFQRRQMKTREQLLRAEKELLELEHQQTLETQANYERELGDYTQLLLEKNRQMDNLNQELQEVRQRQSTVETQQLTEQLSNTSILTEADWRNFRQKFERVHAGFFDQLAQMVPDATEAEQRLMALTKLELGNDEIAAVLGILPESVTKTRYRLRKKLNDADLALVVRQM